MYYKKVNKNNPKNMFVFLNEHFRYWTANSWNRLQSVANNMKLYNWDIKNIYGVLEVLDDEMYSYINDMIAEFEAKYPDYTVYSNGRSEGYLVLCNNHHNCNIIPDWIADCEDYSDFKYNAKLWYGGVKYTTNELKMYTELVQDFDKLCDDIMLYCISIDKTLNELKD